MWPGTCISQELPLADAEGYCFLSCTQDIAQGLETTESLSEQKCPVKAGRFWSG